MAELKPCDLLQGSREGVIINKYKCGCFPMLFDNSNIVKVNSVWWVACPSCKAKGEKAHSFWQAIDAWNKRSGKGEKIK